MPHIEIYNEWDSDTKSYVKESVKVPDEDEVQCRGCGLFVKTWDADKDYCERCRGN